MIFKHSLFSFIKDLRAFGNIVPDRQAHFDAAATSLPVSETGANLCEKSLHPQQQTFVVSKVESTESGTKAELKGETAAFFRCGQSVNILTDTAVYPCFLVSSPKESKKGNYTIFTSSVSACEYLKSAGSITVSAPVGTFFYQSIRDGRNIAFCVDETGKPVSEAIIADAAENYPDVKTICVSSVAEIPEGFAVFAIGTHAFCKDIPDYIGGKKVRKLRTDEPVRCCDNKEYNCRIIRGEASIEIKVSSSETLLAAFEKHNLLTAVKCRDGECGFCRCRLLEGEVFTLGVSDKDGLREADSVFGYIHPCRCFPDSDITVKF